MNFNKQSEYDSSSLVVLEVELVMAVAAVVVAVAVINGDETDVDSRGSSSFFPSTASACNDNDLRAICPSRAMVLTSAGMMPQSVSDAVPEGTEITADVRVRTESMNSKARSSRSFKGRGGG